MRHTHDDDRLTFGCPQCIADADEARWTNAPVRRITFRAVVPTNILTLNGKPIEWTFTADCQIPDGIDWRGDDDLDYARFDVGANIAETMPQMGDSDAMLTLETAELFITNVRPIDTAPPAEQEAMFLMRLVIELDGRPPTANAERKGSGAHWAMRSASTKDWRQRAEIACRNMLRRPQNAPAKGSAAIEVTAQQMSKDRRWLQDLGACAPAVKAAIDGLVDAKLIPDDTLEYLRRLSYIPPDICGRDGLRLIIDCTEATA